MPKVHRVGDFDSNKDVASTGSDNVFANGGPTLGGIISEVFDTNNIVGITDEAARHILSDKADEISRGEIDPDMNEPLEQFYPASGKGINPIDGSTDIIGAPGSPAGGTSGSFGGNLSDDDETGTVPFDNKQLISDLSSTIKQLNKYSCINSIYRANLPWSCNKNAPKGWAKYYGLKIKNLEKQKGICSS